SDRTRNLRLTTYSSTFFFSHILPPPISTLFPYTTLFRSGCCLLSHFSSLPSGKVFFFMKLCQKRQNRGLHGSCYARFLFINVDIHFGAHAKLRQINSGLHGIAGARDQVAGIVCFEPVHVRTVA